ncbi:hypothetical protein BRDCF_p1613 [Bacteroidales bacterium CF]|nr:hypothetical protein BRDCF_p1613 [Bacteroidales bacterium CF]
MEATTTLINDKLAEPLPISIFLAIYFLRGAVIIIRLSSVKSAPCTKSFSGKRTCANNLNRRVKVIAEKITDIDLISLLSLSLTLFFMNNRKGK